VIFFLTPFYEQRLEIARAIGDRRSEGNTLGNLGIAYAALGNVRQAIAYYEQALAITREIGDRRGEGNALGNLGIAYAVLADPERAISFHEQNLAIALGGLYWPPTAQRQWRLESGPNPASMMVAGVDNEPLAQATRAIFGLPKPPTDDAAEMEDRSAFLRCVSD